MHEELKRQRLKWAVGKFLGEDRKSNLDEATDASHRLTDRPNIATLNSMLTDPGISFPLHLLKLPVSRSELVYTNPNNEIQEFIREEITELKRTILFNALTALEYGFAPFERRMELRDCKYRNKEYINLKPKFIWIKIHSQNKGFDGIEQRYKGKRI